MNFFKNNVALLTYKKRLDKAYSEDAVQEIKKIFFELKKLNYDTEQVLTQKNEKEISPLMKIKSVEAARVLVKQGADIKAMFICEEGQQKYKKGVLCFHLENESLALYLLNSGAFVNDKNTCFEDNLTQPHMSSFLTDKNLNLLKIAYSKFDFNEENNKKYLTYTFQSQDFKTFAYLLSQGLENVNNQIDNKSTVRKRKEIWDSAVDLIKKETKPYSMLYGGYTFAVTPDRALICLKILINSAQTIDDLLSIDNSLKYEIEKTFVLETLQDYEKKFKEKTIELEKKDLQKKMSLSPRLVKKFKL